MSIINHLQMTRHLLFAVLFVGCISDPLDVLTPDSPVSWVSIPGFDYGGGDIAASNDGVIIMGGDALFKSTNGGVTWSRIGPLDYSFNVVERFDNGQFAAIAYPNTEFDSHDYVVFTSSDNGEHWNQMAVLQQPRCIELDPQDRLFVGAYGGCVFRSIDNGATWIQVNNGLNENINGVRNRYVRDILHVDGDLFLAGTAGGIVRTTDAGDSWTRVALDDYGVPKLLKVTATNILATSGPGVYRSTDLGVTWSLVQTASYLQDLVLTASGRIVAVGDTGIFVSNDQGTTWSWHQGPGDPNVTHLVSAGSSLVLTSYSNVYRSTDDGMSWTESNAGVSTGGVLSFARSGNTVFVSSSSGFLKSPFPPSNWQELPADPPREIHVGKDNEIYTLNVSNSISYLNRSSDEGVSWNPIDHSVIPTFIRSIGINSAGSLFAGDAEGGIFRSTNSGQSWEKASAGIALTTIRYISVNGRGVIVAGDDHESAVASTDFGASWRLVGHPGESHTSLTVDESGTIWWGGVVGNLYRSTDLGATWTSYPVHPGSGHNVGEVIRTASGDIVVKITLAGVFRSRDNGANWSLISNPIIGSSVGRLYRDREGYLYLGVNGGGAYRTQNPLP